MKHIGKIISRRGLQAITEDATRYWWNKTQAQIKDKNMLNNQLFQYSQQNFTCDKCSGEFQQSKVYSPTSDKQELSNFPTYCSNCIEPTLIVPTKPNKIKAKPNKNPVAYYQCMSACCQQGISPKKISQVAQECKRNSAGILAERTSEIRKLNEAYQQIGISLTSLLQPIQE